MKKEKIKRSSVSLAFIECLTDRGFFMRKVKGKITTSVDERL